MKNFALALGSKPNPCLPDINPKVVIAANGAALLAEGYKAMAQTTISMVGHKEIFKSAVWNNVAACGPDQIVVRQYNESLGLPEPVRERPGLRFLLPSENYGIQRQLLRDNCDFRLSEWSVKYLRRGKVKTAIRTIRNWSQFFPMGLSTGLFCGLWALHEYDVESVIYSGIGMSPGGHFYGAGSFSSHRAMMDKNLVANLKANYRDKLFTTERELEKNSGGAIRFIDVPLKSFTV